MAIIIQNIDKNPREKGEHLYQLRINDRVICEFSHNREDGLYKCLIKAAAATAQWALLDKLVKSKR